MLLNAIVGHEVSLVREDDELEAIILELGRLNKRDEGEQRIIVDRYDYDIKRYTQRGTVAKRQPSDLEALLGRTVLYATISTTGVTNLTFSDGTILRQSGPAAATLP